MRLRFGWRWWAGFALVVVLALVAQRTLFRAPAIEVEVARAEIGPVETVVTNSEAGTVKTRAQARVGAERAGRVAAIPCREGAAVRRGALLVQLDASTAATRLEAARRDQQALNAAREVAHSSATLARQNFERARQLREQGLIAQEQMDEARSRFEGAEAEVRAAEARLGGAESSVRLAQDEVAHLEVRAPFDGVITRRFVEVGESVVPGQPVLEVMSLSRLYVSAPIDERDAGPLREGLPARVTIDTYPGVTWNGRVTRVAPMVEVAKEQNRTIEIEVDLPVDPSRPQPRPGMTADVETILDRRDGVLRVPTLAVIEGRRVLTLDGDKAVAREVNLGAKNWEWSEIRSGLKPGEKIVTSLDRPGLKAGSRVAERERAAEGERPAGPAAAVSRP